MNRAVVFIIPIVAAVLTGGARADSRDEAVPKDLRRLEADVANLDDDVQALEPEDAKADAFRQRAGEIREDVIYLKVKMRRQQRSGEEGTGVSLDEVEDVRREIGELREDMAAAFSSGAVGELRVAAGTELVVRLEDPLSSRTARTEDRFDATVLDPIRVGRAKAIQAGTRVRGVVRAAEPAERPSRAGKLDLEFDRIYLETARLDMRAHLASMEAAEHSTAHKAGIGAVLGGLFGSLVGGKQGLVVGALVGGTGAVVATKGDDVELPAGSLLTLRLDEDLVIPPARR
jgi:outer membrane murein-binding lipoprotein Lpp